MSRPGPPVPRWLPPLLLGLGLLPFFGQAYHIDDQIYLMGAEAVRRDPLRPHGLTTGFLGQTVPFHRGVNSHPAGLPYYLALWPGVGQGRPEWRAHLALLPFAGLLLWAVGRWARHSGLGLDPGPPALLLAVLPPVWLMGHTIMTDLPHAALLWAAAYAGLRAARSGGVWRLLLAGVLATAAWSVQYRGLLALPLAGLLWRFGPGAPPLGERRAGAVRLLGLGVTTALLFLGWAQWNRWELGESHFAFSGGQILYSGERLLLSLTALLCHAGGTLFPLAGLALWRLRRDRAALLTLLGAALLAGTSLPLLLDAGVPGPRGAVGLCAGLGLLVLGGAAAVGWRSGGVGRLWAALLMGLLSLQTVVSLFAAARLLLPLLPPLLLCLCARPAAEPEVAPAPLPRRGLLAAAGLCAALAGLLSWADYRYAGVYRAEAPALAELARANGGRGFFVGEWGLRAYLEAEGLRYLTAADRSPRRGDVVIVPGLNCPWPLHPALRARLGPPQPYPLPGAFPLRTMDPGLGAGFYSDGYGPLPFAPSAWDRPYDTLQLYPVVR